VLSDVRLVLSIRPGREGGESDLPTSHDACILRVRMRWICALLVLVSGCASFSSPWERHQQSLAQDEAQGQYAQAAAEVQWMIENALLQGPANQQTPQAEAARYLHLADLAAKAGNQRLAVEALRETLTIDPHQAPKIRARLAKLPVSAVERERLEREFAWNSAALAPADDAVLEADPAQPDCWSYRASEVRIRHRRTLRTADGMQRRVSYAARQWLFDTVTRAWRPDGAWLEDAGAVAELVEGPAQPRYRAVVAANHGFYVEGTVPACHRDAWQGPYDRDGTGFVAAHLPGASASEPHATY